MTDFTFYTIETAPEDATDILEQIQKVWVYS